MKRKNMALASIGRQIRRMWFLTLIIAVVVIGAVVSALLPPLVLERAVNLLTDREQVPLVLIVGYFGLLALSGILDSAKEALLTVFGQKITHALRSDLCSKLTRLPADSFVRTEPGVTASRFVGDVDTVETLFTSGIISMFADACQVISIFIILFLKNRGLALLLLFLLPLVFLFTRTVQKRMLKAEKDNRAAIGKSANHVPETIHCIRTIHTLRAEPFMEEKYDRHIQESYAAIEKTNFYDAVYSPIILILNAVTVAFVMILAATGNIRIRSFFGMSVGTAVAVISYISQVFTPIESIGMEIQTIQTAAAGVHRINEFLLQEERTSLSGMSVISKSAGNPASDSTGNSTVDAGEDCCICLENVSFSYQTDQPVLDHINLAVRRGDQLTITGRTGAGKSTIFKLLLGLYQPEHGSVKINGREASEIPDWEKRHLFGYVEQNFYTAPGSVMDQIRLFDPKITEEAARNAARTVGLDETICAFEKGYDTTCTEGLFSQGQWQLLSIARAIAADPDILLLDEITANLDSDTEQMVLNAVRNASADRTVLSISHRLYEHLGGREFILETSKCKP